MNAFPGYFERKPKKWNQKNFLAVPILCLLITYTWQLEILVTALFMKGLIILNLRIPGTWLISLMIALSLAYSNSVTRTEMLSHKCMVTISLFFQTASTSTMASSKCCSRAMFLNLW